MRILSLVILNLFILISSCAYGQSEVEKNRIKLSGGTIVNAETLFSSSSATWGPGFQIDYQRRISDPVFVGLKVHYFNLDNLNYLLFAPGVYSSLIQKEKVSLILISHIGYALGEHTTEVGNNWGGVNLGLGVEYAHLINKDNNLGISISINYFLQEKKYRGIFGLIASDMKHAFGFNIGLNKGF
ncbi:MAG: hypothetical protein CL840_11465 [Crocinitomicaceae bacterium]|nr:hypothetical protein [Crocinitomicaceae bacterium]|tara:strand:- start:5935 stop:6489 length:555 start_codon:yes stop_codon:yes gene_type:complete